VGRGATAGVLIKNAEVLEIMEKVDTLVIDKTGTLTQGKPALSSVVPVRCFTEAEVLRLSASIERSSEHPLASAIVKEANKRALSLAVATNFQSVPGKGVRGTVEGKPVVLGNVRMMQELGISQADLTGPAERLRAEGQTVMYLAVDE